MSEPAHTEHDKARTLRAAALVLLMSLAAGLPSLWTRDLWHGDEVRLTEGARQLAESGEGFLPRVNGDIVRTDAPLPYWAAALAWKAGAGAASARVVSVVAAIGIALVCFAATVRTGGLARATVASAIALTTVGLLLSARSGTTGTLWALLFTCALLAGRQALGARPGRRAAWWAACYAAAALAVLAAGVSAALLAALVLGIYCVAARRRPLETALSHLPGLVVFAAVIGLWLAGASRASPENGLAWDLLTRDLAGLAASLHEGGFLTALLATAAALLPWGVLIPGGLARAIQQRREHGADLPVFALAWLAALAAPAVLGGRRGAPDYVIAMAPPLAMLCAGVLVPGLDVAPLGRRQRWLVRSMLVALAVVTGAMLLVGLFDVAGGAYLIVGQRYLCPVTDQPYSPYAMALALPFVAGSLAATVAAFRTPVGRPARQAWLLVLAIVLLAIPADLFLTPFADTYLSARPFAERIVQRVQPSDGLYLYRKDYDGLYNLYTGRTVIPVLKTEEQLLECLSQPARFVIADEKRIRHTRASVRLPDRAVVDGHVGSHHMLLLRGGPPPEGRSALLPDTGLD